MAQRDRRRSSGALPVVLAAGLILLVLVVTFATDPSFRCAVVSNRYYGETPAESMTAIRALDFEAVAVYQPDGTKVLEFTEERQDMIEPSWLMRQALNCSDGLIVIHNHPGSGDEVGLSSDDIRFAASYNVSEMIVISQSGAVSLRPGEHGWGDPVELAERLAKLGEDSKEAQAEQEQAGTVLSERWWSSTATHQLADEYGLWYASWSGTDELPQTLAD